MWNVIQKTEQEAYGMQQAAKQQQWHDELFKQLLILCSAI